MWQCRRKMKNDSLIATDASKTKLPFPFRCVVFCNLWLSFLIQMDSNHLPFEKRHFATKQIRNDELCKNKTRTSHRKKEKQNKKLLAKNFKKMFVLNRIAWAPSVSIRCYQIVIVSVYHPVWLCMLSLKLCFCSTSNQYRTFWLFKTTTKVFRFRYSAAVFVLQFHFHFIRL